MLQDGQYGLITTLHQREAERGPALIKVVSKYLQFYDAYQPSIDSRSHYTEMAEAPPRQKCKRDEPPGARKRRRVRSSVERASAETARSLGGVAAFKDV
ncbi:hypothetical protein JG687_00008349 [Phytophthora cactorum]|uniref:Uncharacterized protein n=2 Tax=Phytophthora cactorum TaxID=29920 RepID=A0A8T1UCZ0_9STRA|nr:hypothetical protein JG687_00008349 [Phytophthora cactorum]